MINYLRKFYLLIKLLKYIAKVDEKKNVFYKINKEAQ